MCITICTACFYYHFYVDSPVIFLILGQNFLVYVWNDWIVMFVDLSTILPKNLDFPSGVFSLRNPGLQQRDGMQFNSARLKVKPWEVSLVFIGHLKKSARFLTRASAMDTHTHTCQLKFALVFCRDKWHHVSRNQLLHDKSVGDVSGQVLLPLFLKAPRGEKNIYQRFGVDLFEFFLYQNLGFKDWFRIILQYSVWMFIAIIHWAMLSIWDLMGEPYGIMGRFLCLSWFLFGGDPELVPSRFEGEELGDITSISPVIKSMAANRLTFAGWSEYHMVVQICAAIYESPQQR